MYIKFWFGERIFLFVFDLRSPSSFVTFPWIWYGQGSRHVTSRHDADADVDVVKHVDIGRGWDRDDLDIFSSTCDRSYAR